MARAKCLHTAERVPNWSGALICPECRKDWRARDYRKHYVRFILTSARLRAVRDGVPFDLVAADIVIPVFCPVLGLELEIGARGIRGGTDASPSLDRFIPSLGYVRGNVAVISNKANRMKADGSLEEHEALVRWMRANST
jgi:hypothetical protein